MRTTPLERITVELPADRRLVSVLRAAIVFEARTCGMSPARAVQLARAVARGFRDLSSRPGQGGARPVSVSLDRGTDELRVVVEAGNDPRPLSFSAKCVPRPRLRAASGARGRRRPAV